MHPLCSQKFKSIDQVNNLREIQALRRLMPHPNIVNLEEVLYDKPTGEELCHLRACTGSPTAEAHTLAPALLAQAHKLAALCLCPTRCRCAGRLALVFELMSMNLYELIRNRKNHLNNQLVKIYCFQALRALDQMHSKGVFHRDIKVRPALRREHPPSHKHLRAPLQPENILIESSYDVYTGLKLADFGSCRGIKSKQPYTEYISTRWYRAPECLLTDGYYGAEMDIWGVSGYASTLLPLQAHPHHVRRSAVCSSSSRRCSRCSQARTKRTR